MNSTLKIFFLLSEILSGIFPHLATASEYNTLVYKNCSNQTITGSTDSHSKTLSSLFHELLPHSSESQFFKATAGDVNHGVSGLFQCRGDLSSNDCYDCVNSLPELSNSLCNQAAAGRIQLHGCYFHYEADEFNIHETSKYEYMQKICGQKAAGIGFEEVRDEAFAAMEIGVTEGNGFYSGGYESVHTMAQCEGDLEGCDCGECVSIAAQIARQECIDSISGQIYMDRCYISYSYYPHGVPDNSHKGKLKRINGEKR